METGIVITMGVLDIWQKNCRNRGIGGRIRKSRRLEYEQRRTIKEENKQNNNLNRDRDLIVLD